MPLDCGRELEHFLDKTCMGWTCKSLAERLHSPCGSRTFSLTSDSGNNPCCPNMSRMSHKQHALIQTSGSIYRLQFKWLIQYFEQQWENTVKHTDNIQTLRKACQLHGCLGETFKVRGVTSNLYSTNPIICVCVKEKGQVLVSEADKKVHSGEA